MHKGNFFEQHFHDKIFINSNDKANRILLYATLPVNYSAQPIKCHVHYHMYSECHEIAASICDTCMMTNIRNMKQKQKKNKRKCKSCIV